MRIALIGNGKMGSALLKQWIETADTTFKGHEFFVIDPALEEGEAPLSGPVTYLREPPAEADSQFGLVIMAVKPQIMDKVLPDYKARLSADGFVASVAAGCSIARLSTLAGGAAIIRIMPNLPAAIGQGVSGLCAEDRATKDQRALVQALMDAAGTTLWVKDEDELDRLTAVAGSGPGYVFEIARTYVEAARSIGFSTEQARKLVLGTMAGTIAMAADSSESLDTLRTNVTSKNGTTAAGLDALNGDGGLDKRLRATIDAAYARAVELR